VRNVGGSRTADEALWTVQDLQEYLRVGRTLAWTLIARGEIPVVRVGRAVRLRPADVRAWTARQAGAPE
jgi:excisionase family DNA binding protein